MLYYIFKFVCDLVRKLCAGITKKFFLRQGFGTFMHTPIVEVQVNWSKRPFRFSNAPAEGLLELSVAQGKFVYSRCIACISPRNRLGWLTSEGVKATPYCSIFNFFMMSHLIYARLTSTASSHNLRVSFTTLDHQYHICLSHRVGLCTIYRFKLSHYLIASKRNEPASLLICLDCELVIT